MEKKRAQRTLKENARRERTRSSPSRLRELVAVEQDSAVCDLFRAKLLRPEGLDLGDGDTGHTDGGVCGLWPIRGEKVNLAVGDLVVYGAHGVGSVAARETRSVDGEQETVVVIAFAGGLSVQLPLARAQAQLRSVVDEQGIATIESVLRAAPLIRKEPWLKRRRESEAKLRDAVGLAEVIRDGNARETAPARSPGSPLSPGERELVRRARELLTHEIALARGVAVAEAGAWLDAQLAR